MGIRMPGLASGIPPDMVEKLIQAERIPLETANKRKELVVNEKKEFEKLQTHLTELDQALTGLKTRGDFFKLKVESSHPDIIEGTVSANAVLGNYEFEVRGMAKNEKELALGFPDRNETPVGFGFMMIEREDMEPAELTIEPGFTLEEVASQINDAQIGVKAMVINTKFQPDPYRLLIISEKSGKEAAINIDEDTTFLEFKEQVTGRNLDILFEDVPVTDEDNQLDELVEGATFYVKRAEPGTRVQVNITHDVDATMEGIKGFVEKYNTVASFINGQFAKNPDTDRAGVLAGDASIKTILRQLQSALGSPLNSSSKFNTLADIGITTDPKSGTLKLDETKVKAALAEDYEGVASLFIHSRAGAGAAERMASQLKGFRDPGNGIVRSRIRGLDKVIENQDKAIENRERLLTQREEMIRRKFTALEGQMAGMQQQGNFLAAKMGSGQAPQGGGG